VAGLFGANGNAAQLDLTGAFGFAPGPAMAGVPSGLPLLGNGGARAAGVMQRWPA